jgi:hypothetical protein
MGSANSGSQNSSLGTNVCGGGETDSTKDTIFMILRSSRRRLILHYLEESEGTRTRGELARYVAAAEEGVEMSQVTTTDRKRVYVSLHQTHLPTMDDVGIIDYDKDRGTVELREANAREFYQYLHFDPAAVSLGGDETDDGQCARAMESEVGDRSDERTQATPASGELDGHEDEDPAEQERPHGVMKTLFSLF